MSHFRVISRLDVKSPNLVKGVRLEGLRVVGDPAGFALRYYQDGADEIFFQDIVATLYGRESVFGLVSQVASEVFVPLTVGGGIATLADVEVAMASGADRVAVNSAAVGRPALITEIAARFGSQAAILSIEATEVSPGRWEALTDCGRERTGLCPIEWSRQAVDLGAGEIVLTSVDRDGRRCGFDLPLIAEAAQSVHVPVIAHGGGGSLDDLVAARDHGAGGVALGTILHYREFSIPDLKRGLEASGVAIRP